MSQLISLRGPAPPSISTDATFSPSVYTARCISGTDTMKYGPRTVLLLRRCSISVVVDIMVDIWIQVEDWLLERTERSIGPRPQDKRIDTSGSSFGKRY